jgi:F0F1-type ATP synthase delta subunit
MAKISVQNIAQAIAGHTKGKSGGDLDIAVKETLTFLNKKKLLNRSDEILDAVGKIIDKEDGVVRIKVLSAKSLDGHEKKEIEEFIKKKYKQKK